ncbi:hypothetical protein QQ045_006723 [Rhodiola kirilowii]
MSTLIDALYCNEELFDELGDGDFGLECCDGDQKTELFGERDLVFDGDEDELARLLVKEESGGCVGVIEDAEVVEDRSRAVEWLVKVNCYFGFSPLTCVLAVDYFDRFARSLGLRSDKPWMGQLVAVACLSLAAKMEEVEVPLLLDLQVEECKYVFEAKTVQRMELLILSTLKWKMNPVTPVCYFDHIFRRIGVRTNLHWEFLWRCERLLLSVIVDSRYKCYAPSVLATATMLYVIQEVEPCNSLKFQNQLMDVLKLSKEKVDGCYKFLIELFSNDVLVHDLTRKWRYNSAPSNPRSPSAVINMSFSCENSSDSWEVMASTFVSSSEPPFKRCRAQDQLMRLH